MKISKEIQNIAGW